MKDNKDKFSDGFEEMDKDDEASPFAVPLTYAEWMARDLPPPDRLIGEWLTTTSRVYVSADTGLGKTSLLMAIGVHGAAAANFLRWRCHRKARVLFIDGEMSRRLLKTRIHEAAVRVAALLGIGPDSALSDDAKFLSREDIEDFPPLNTPAGITWLLAFVDSIMGSVDLIIFDNVMALLEGDQKDEVSWNAALPLVSALTKRSIGQIWIDHTGHDASRGYGSKTKQWRMDTVIHLTAVTRADTDISFLLEFRKARERTPETRADFEDATFALIDDVWIEEGGKRPKGKPSDQEEKILEELDALLIDSNTVTHRGHRALHVDLLRDRCLLKRRVTTDNAFRACLSRMANKGLIDSEGDLVWRS